MIPLVAARATQALTMNLGTVPGVSVIALEMGSTCIKASEKEMWMPAVSTESTRSRKDQEPKPTSTLEDFRRSVKQASTPRWPSYKRKISGVATPVQQPATKLQLQQSLLWGQT